MADVYKRTVRCGLVITKNGVTRVNEEYLTSNVTCTVLLHDRAVLATNMTSFSEVDLGGVTTAAVVMLETDRAINVAFNTTGNVVALGDTGMVSLVGVVTHVYVQNTNTTYTATIEVVATD